MPAERLDALRQADVGVELVGDGRATCGVRTAYC
jgi:hypothetical protein